MADLEKRASVDIVASAAGGTVGPLVAGLMAMAAAVTDSPDLAIISIPIGAAADAVTEEGVRRIAKSIRFQHAAERVSRFAEAIAEETGGPMDEFIEEHVTCSNHREFLGHVVAATVAARSDWKIRILARAFTRGIKDGDRIDETEMFVKAIRHMEPSHARALSAAIRTMQRADVGHVDSWSLKSYDKGIGAAAPLLWRDLRDQGLVVEIDTKGRRPDGGVKMKAETREGFAPTDLGYAIGGWLRELDAETAQPVSD